METIKSSSKSPMENGPVYISRYTLRYAYKTLLYAFDPISRCNATFQSLSLVSLLQGSGTVISFCRIIGRLRQPRAATLKDEDVDRQNRIEITFFDRSSSNVSFYAHWARDMDRFVKYSVPNGGEISQRIRSITKVGNGKRGNQDKLRMPERVQLTESKGDEMSSLATVARELTEKCHVRLPTLVSLNLQQVLLMTLKNVNKICIRSLEPHSQFKSMLFKAERYFSRYKVFHNVVVKHIIFTPGRQKINFNDR